MTQTDDGDVLSPIYALEQTLSVREQILDVLLEKIEDDRYPSATMMDDVERLLTPWRKQDYARILMDKIRDDRYPSRSMIERVIKLSGGAGGRCRAARHRPSHLYDQVPGRHGVDQPHAVGRPAEARSVSRQARCIHPQHDWGTPPRTDPAGSLGVRAQVHRVPVPRS